ncbi:MAG: M48 family metalloprotease [Halothece sp.]
MKLSWNALLLSLALILTPTVAWSDSSEEKTSQEKEEQVTEEEEDTPPTLEEKISELLPDLTEQESEYLATLSKADEHYQAGDKKEAEALYREAKVSFSNETLSSSRNPYYEEEELPPGGNVYWRYGKAEFDPKLKTKSIAPLQHLVTEYPDFIPGHIRYAEALVYFDETEKAISHLEQAIPRYPQQVELVEAILPLYEETEQWLNASLTARQFALLNPEHSKAEEFKTLAEQRLEQFESALRSELRGNVIANVITGGLGFALTGSLLGPLSALDSTTLLLRGESGVGESFSNRLQEELPLVEDEELNNYVNEIGNTLIPYAGRDDFEYEFHIIMDENLNAFALPGGKIFINAGAILKTESEAELAGLIAHELAHAVLSHGFQLVTEGNLLANVGQFVPLGRTAANLVVLDYSRGMEREADQMGTRLMASSDYAADGLYNLMTTLEEDKKDQPSPPVWLSTHPGTEERINNIKTQIINNNYNRYSYEGVSDHQAMKEKMAKLLAQHQLEKEAEENEQENEDDEN